MVGYYNYSVYLTYGGLVSAIIGITRAMERDITACYALEGMYPPDLEYIRVHYGLTYPESRFYVDYRPIASNIRPDYAVIMLRQEKGGGQ